MDATTDSVVNAATFYKLVEMFGSSFRDEANKLLGLALSDLRKSHNLLCDQCDDAGYAKARRDECAGLRYDLKQAFARYADGELNADEVQEIIARVAERCAEIEQDVSTTTNEHDSGPAPAPLALSSPSFAEDFHVPAQTAHVPFPEPAAALEIEDENEDEDEKDNVWAALREIWEDFWDRETVEGLIGFACICIVIALIIHFGDDPEARKSFIDWFHSPISLVGGGFVIETVIGVVAGLALLWLLHKTLPDLGWIGLSLKVALAVDCLFACYIIDFHETPWNFMHGGPFPSLATPVYPFVIACVLAAGVLIMPEVAEWVHARPSRLRKVFFTAAVLVVISIFVIRDRPASVPAQAAAPSQPEPAIQPPPQPQAAPDAPILSPWRDIPPSAYRSERNP